MVELVVLPVRFRAVLGLVHAWCSEATGVNAGALERLSVAEVEAVINSFQESEDDARALCMVFGFQVVVLNVIKDDLLISLTYNGARITFSEREMNVEGERAIGAFHDFIHGKR